LKKEMAVRQTLPPASGGTRQHIIWRFQHDLAVSMS
jgi:hypothetical protein